MSILSIDLKRAHRRSQNSKLYFTYADLSYLPMWPESPLVELTEGELFLVPSPTPAHQMISKKIFRLLDDYVSAKNLGVVFYAPVDVYLSEENVLIPDLIFISKEKATSITKKNVQGPPDLVIEIISSDRDRDMVDKRTQYEKFAVPEYWVIDEENKQIHVFVLAGGKYGPSRIFRENDVISPILPSLGDLKIPVKSVF